MMVDENIVRYLEKLSKDDPDWPALKNALAYFKNTYDTISITHAKERVEYIGSYIDSVKNNNKKAIDVGSNFGIITFILAEKGYKTIAVDTYKRIFDKILLPIAKLKKIDDDIDYYVGYGEKLPYDDNYFDIVTCGEVIEHIENKKLEAFLNEISRILKTNGTLIITTPNGNNISKKFLNKHGLFINEEHIKEYKFNELKDILLTNGFEIHNYQFINHDLFPMSIFSEKYPKFYNLFYKTLKSVCKKIITFNEIFSLGIVIKCTKVMA